MPIAKPTDPIRNRRHIELIKVLLKERKKYVQYLFFTLAINSGLRVSDMLSLKIGDIWNDEGKARKEFSMHAQKTGSLAITQLNDSILKAMQLAKHSLPIHELEAPLFTISRQSVSKWVKKWTRDVGIDTGNYAAHSLRKTFAYQLWVAQGKSGEALVVVSKALGHQSTGTTMDYLGIRREQVAKWQRKLNL